MADLFTQIPLPALGEPIVYPCGNGAQMLLWRDQGESAAEACIAALVDGGFDLVERSSLPTSTFATLRKDGLTVVIDRFESDLRVIADAYTAPYKLTDPCPRTAKTTVWQFEVDHTLIDCGMCFIIRCCDGSFFLIDSGHYFQVNDNDRIHRFLRERTPAGEKIRIAGWFLTHAHSDHVSKFSDFLRYNMDDCELEAVYYNFAEPDAPAGAGWSRRGVSLMGQNLIAQLDALDIPKIKLHTGQHFAVRNLNFTVLCTHEDVFPTKNSDFNNTTTMLMMEAEGSKVLFCGDAGEDESDICERRYGELLECDVLQVAHHGHHGCSAAFYEFAKGKAALFSNTQIFYDLDLIKEKDANETILRHAKEVYISSNGTVGVDLPYVQCRVYPDETFEDFEKIQQLWGYTYTPERMGELYAAYLARGGKVNHCFYRDPNSTNWHDT